MRKPLSVHALVMHVTGFNAMLGVIYHFVDRLQGEPNGRDEPEADDSHEPRAADAKSGDNTP